MPAQAASSTAPHTLGLVFTDAKGRIVFADVNFVEFIGHAEAVRLVGEPLHKILKVDPQSISALIDEVARTGFAHDQRIDLADARGAPIQAICSGVATYDDMRRFIGADLTLTDAGLDRVPSRPADHGDVLSARIQQIQSEVVSHKSEEQLALAQWYFTAQTSALHVLLGRMGGPRVHEATEKLVNQTAARGKWPVQLIAGHFIIDEGTPPDAYRVILSEVVAYAAGVIGRSMVTREMELVDSRMTPRLQEAAGQFGLRDMISM